MKYTDLELFAQIKAFRTYLDSFLQNLDKSENKDSSNEFILDHIIQRYKILRQELYYKNSKVFSTLIQSINIDHISDIQYLLFDIEYSIEIFEKLYNNDGEVQENYQKFKPNNQPFTKTEIQTINTQLDDLQDKLTEIIINQNLTQEKSIPLREIIKSEINELKEEATNNKLGRKDWKNHLINAMITLTFTLSFSTEARATIFNYFQSLFIYLQQNIFLLKQ
ncbi:hypothetical protein BH20ACI4_BH20ACI4_19590 [soil metagenome]